MFHRFRFQKGPDVDHVFMACIYSPIPSLPKSSNYLVSRYLGPLKVLSGGVCGSKYLLTRHLED